VGISQKWKVYDYRFDVWLPTEAKAKTDAVASYFRAISQRNPETPSEEEIKSRLNKLSKP
jgi:hypothetical protein